MYRLEARFYRDSKNNLLKVNVIERYKYAASTGEFVDAAMVLEDGPVNVLGYGKREMKRLVRRAWGKSVKFYSA